MSLSIFINDNNFTGFIEASVTISFLDATGKAEFTVTSIGESEDIYPIRTGDKVQIQINEEPVITGFVDALSNYIDAKSQNIQVSMRDATADLIDSTLSSDNTNEIQAGKGGVSLVKVCEIILKSLNIVLLVIDNANSKPFKKGELITPKLKETAFKFLERYAQQRQVIIRANGSGDLLLEKGSEFQYFTVLNMIRDDESNNVKERTLNIDFTKRFHKYIFESQASAASSDLSSADDPKNPKKILDSVNNVKATTLDNVIRTSRQFAFAPTTSYLQETAKERVTWEANIRRAQSLTYTCKVEGYVAELDQELWKVNRQVLVNDQPANISQLMLIDSVTYKLDLNDGETTTIKLISKDAYTLQAEKDLRTSSTDKVGDNWAILGRAADRSEPV